MGGLAGGHSKLVFLGSPWQVGPAPLVSHRHPPAHTTGTWSQRPKRANLKSQLDQVRFPQGRQHAAGQLAKGRAGGPACNGRALPSFPAKGMDSGRGKESRSPRHPITQCLPKSPGRGSPLHISLGSRHTLWETLGRQCFQSHTVLTPGFDTEWLPEGAGSKSVDRAGWMGSHQGRGRRRAPLCHPPRGGGGGRLLQEGSLPAVPMMPLFFASLHQTFARPLLARSGALPEASLPELRSCRNCMAGRGIHLSCVLLPQEGTSRMEA